MAKKIKEVSDLPGIGSQSLEKLFSAGYKTLESIATASPMELIEAAGLGEGTADKAIKAARNALEMGFETAADLADKRKTIGRITTGSKELDELLGGGIESLPPEEEILIIENNKLKRIEIGKFIDKQLENSSIEKQNFGKTLLSYENKKSITVPAFDNNYNIKEKKITGFVKHKREEPIYEVKLKRGRKIKVTAGHSLFKLSGLEVIPTKAMDLKQGNYIAVPKKINFNFDLDELNAIELMLETNSKYLRKIYVKNKEYIDYLYENFKEPIIKAIKKLKYKERWLWDWKHEKILPVELFKKLPKEAYTIKKLKKFNVKIGRESYIDSVIPLNNDSLWLMGFLTAEAGMTMEKPQIGISQHINNVQVLEKTQQIIKNSIGSDITIFNDNSTISNQKKLVSGNTALWVLLDGLGLKKHSYNKKIPDFIFGLSNQKIISFLKGFFEGDGITKRGTIGWCTSSKQLTKDLMLLLIKLGEIPVLATHKHKNPNCHTMNTILAFKLKHINELGKNIEARHDENILPIKEKILEIIKKYKLTNKLNKFYHYAKVCQPKVSTIKKFITELNNLVMCEDVKKIEKLIQCDLFFEEIVSVKKLEYEPEFVYDLQVLDNPIIDNFIGGTFICTHNTQSITEVYGKMASGKCVSKNTQILYFNPNKAHLNSIEEIYENYAINETPFDEGFIADLKKPIKVIGIDKNGKEMKKEVSKLYKEYVKDIIEIETESGALVELTERHPLLTLNSEGIQWKSTGLLKKGDYIGTPTKINLNNSINEITKEDAYFLGLFVAKGCVNPCSITIFEKKIQKWLINYTKQRFGYKPKFVKNKNLIIFQKPTKEFLKKLKQCKSDNKFVPEEIINAKQESIKEFLRGYIEGGMHLGKIIEITTKSKRLAEQLTYIFSILGINSNIKTKTIKKGKYKNNKHYKIYITNEKNKIKIKKIKYSNKNKVYKYGVPIQKIKTIYQKIYSQLVGPKRKFNKWNKNKMNKTNSSLFISLFATQPKTERITHETINKINNFFKMRLQEIIEAKKLLRNPNKENILQVLSVLPFQTKKIRKKLGIKKSSFQNYITKKMSNKKISLIATTLNEMIEELKNNKKLIKNFKTMELLSKNNIQWEKITKIEKKEYNDWVYDLTVPETHSFIGGNKPIFMHNTQWCFQTSVTVQLPKEEGGLEGACLYIDSENSFRPERIQAIAKAKGLDPEKVLKNVFVGRAYNADHQILLVQKASDIIKEKNIKLVIVDSLIAQFRAEYIGRGKLADRQQKLNKHLRDLQKLAEMNNIAVLVTNQVMSRPDILFGDPTEPVGGNVVGHACKQRLYLRKSKENKRIAKLVDSPSLPDGEALYLVTENGIEDA